MKNKKGGHTLKARMGIPGITREIIKKYPDIAKDHTPVPNLLCLDFNPIIYNAYAIVLETAENGQEIESRIIDTVILELVSLLEYVYNDTPKEDTRVFLAIDGTAPYAKIKQQRERRYKKAIHSLLLGSKPDIFDTSYIIPGTQFMDKLSEALSVFAQDSRYNITMSDHTFPGEGEHKILAYLKANKKEKTVCVYSNDGDMLVLLNRGGIVVSNNTGGVGGAGGGVLILSDTKGSSSDTIRAFKSKYFSIDITRFSVLLLNEIKNSSEYITVLSDSSESGDSDDIVPAFCVSDQSVLDDFIFMMSLAGNDFVKPITFTKMRDRDTFNVLIGIYSSILNRRKHNLTVTGDGFVHVNYDFLVDFFLGLAKIEKYKMNVAAISVCKVMNSAVSRRASAVTDPKEVLEHTVLYSKAHPLFPVYSKDFAYVYNMSDTHPVRKDKYARYFFGDTPMTLVVQEYLRSMIYTFKYYTDQVPSWEYAYPYRVAPLPSEILQVLRGMSHDQYKKLFSFALGKVFSRKVQLLLALPREKLLALDTSFGLITSDPQLQEKYPDYNDIHIDAVAEHKFIYCEPILPEFTTADIRRIQKSLSKKGKGVCAEVSHKK